MRKVYNFSPGPAMLPPVVMKEAQEEFLDFKGSGMSILEVSHRSELFNEVIQEAEQDLRTLMNIPENYEVLFVQGGASTQFAMVPLNLMRTGKADFLDTGTWSVRAMEEAGKYGTTNVVASGKGNNYVSIPVGYEQNLDPEADYLHITTNNTIFGTRLDEIKRLDKVPLVADMSSNILAEGYSVNDYGLIYAGAQKNIGPAGLTIVIIRKDLIGNAHRLCPKMLNYQTHSKKKSLYNTPPTFAIYLTGKVFKWALNMGGIPTLEERNKKKAKLLYDFLDDSPFYTPLVQVPDRSLMNVCFRTSNQTLDDKLVVYAAKQGCNFLKGHRSVGGLRASIYNAMEVVGVQHLVKVLRKFERQH